MKSDWVILLHTMTDLLQRCVRTVNCCHGVQPGSEEATSTQSQGSSEAQEDSSGAKADEGQGNADPQQDNNGGAQPLEKEGADTAQGDLRGAGKEAAADVSLDSERTETGVQQRSSETEKDRRWAADISGGRQRDGAASMLADKQRLHEDGGRLGEGIWVIDLTVDDPAALKDGEDTYMVCTIHLPSPRTSDACL